MNGHIYNHLSVRSSKAFYNTQSCRIPQTYHVFDPRQVPLERWITIKYIPVGKIPESEPPQRKTTEGLETPSSYLPTVNLSCMVEGHFSNVEAAELAQVDAALVKGLLILSVDDYALQDNRGVEFADGYSVPDDTASCFCQ